LLTGYAGTVVAAVRKNSIHTMIAISFPFILFILLGKLKTIKAFNNIFEKTEQSIRRIKKFFSIVQKR
jgi:hypothetical protein